MQNDNKDSFGNFNLLRKVGFYLFALSFLVPNWELEGIGVFEFILKSTGLGLFIMTPWAVSHLLTEMFSYFEWRDVFLLIGFSLGWLSNFTVFIRLPKWAAWIAIMAPWLAFSADVFLAHCNPGVVGSGIDTRMLMFIPFYPWAIGIGLIHYSRLKEAERPSD